MPGRARFNAHTSSSCVRPGLFARERMTILEQPYLLIDGVLQSLDGVISIRAEHVRGLDVLDAAPESHDFH